MSKYSLEALSSMSDEDLANIDLGSTESSESAEEGDSQEEEDATASESDEGEADPSMDEDNQEESSDDSSEEEDGEEEEAEEEDDNEADSASDAPDDADSKTQLEKLFTPFNANGTKIKVDSVDEAIELMQMGANYHKKMHILKPHINLIKTLEKNGLLNEDSINFLVDLSKKDKNAISKLMVDGDINPLDLETETVNYSPAKHVVSNEEVQLDEVIQSIKNTPTFTATMDIITQQWDASSKVYLTANPRRIADINAHKASGLFDLINTEMTKQRMFGKLQGLSDFEAYEQVGMQLVQRQMAEAAAKAVQPPKTKPVISPAQKAQKQKLVAPKGKVSSVPPSIDRLASLSDADLLKISEKYL
ncbi:MAG: hypothetical protein ACRCVV_22035 [Shewanella sp.]